MRVSEAMTRDVVVARPDQTICEAATMMIDCDTGALPVGDNDRLIGVITDRDIAVRAVAKNLPPDTPISEVMSKEIRFCYEDEEAQHVAMNMGEIKVRRLPVLNRDKRLVGIVSIGDLSQKTSPDTTGLALAQISRPGGEHSQTA